MMRWNLKELPKAKELFAKVIKDFPESNLAGKAKEKLERLK